MNRKSTAGTYLISTVAIPGGFETVTFKNWTGSVHGDEVACKRTKTAEEAEKAHVAARRAKLGKLPGCRADLCTAEAVAGLEGCESHINWPKAS